MRLVVIGGGEHSRVVIEAARSRPDAWQILGFVDPLPCTETERRLGIERLGNDEESFRLARNSADVLFVLGVGAVEPSPLRQTIVSRYDAARCRWATVVHARAWVSPTATLGRGVVIGAGAVVNSGALIADHCVINSGAIIEHDVTLGAYSQAGPACAIGGGVVVGEGTCLGLGCRIRDHVRIGRNVMVGLGAAVVKPVPDHQIVAGVPAREWKPGRTDGHAP